MAGAAAILPYCGPRMAGTAATGMVPAAPEPSMPPQDLAQEHL
jgi:hypothetical protein